MSDFTRKPIFSLILQIGEVTKADIAARLRETAELIESRDYMTGAGWTLFESKMPDVKTGPRLYIVKVTVDQLVSDDRLDPDDRKHEVDGDYTYEIKAFSPEAAKEQASDMFKNKVVICARTNYEISFTVKEYVCLTGH